MKEQVLVTYASKRGATAVIKSVEMSPATSKLFLTTTILCLIFFCLPGCSKALREEQTATTTAVPLTTSTSQPTSTPAYTPVFASAECQFPYPADVEIQCGYLTVPEDRANPARTIRLHVAIVASRKDNPAPDPVIFLDGGPGGHTLDNVEWLIALHDDILDRRDLILFDQRGVGYSEPSLNCPEIEEARLANIEKPLTDTEQHAVDLAATLTCRQRLVAEGINLSAYHSAASAADLEDLRRALGIESWNLLGVSYGSRLALTAMRDFGHTGAIRSVILESVYPPQVNDYTDLGASADRVFSLLFARCAAIDECREVYPDLEARFYQLVDDLNANPITVRVSDRVNLTNYRVPFDGDDLIEAVFGMMYNKDWILYLPKMIGQLEEGASPILADYLAQNLHVSAYFSEGMGLSVQCVEEAPFTTTAEFRAKTAGLPRQLATLAETEMGNILETCEVWQVTAADPLENEPVGSNIPTLILAGDYDPITPPSHGEETAVFLPNAHYFEFEGVGHGVAGSTSCGMELIAAFLDQPETPPDGGCREHLFFGFVTW